MRTNFLALALGLTVVPAVAGPIVFTGPAAVFQQGGHYTANLSGLIITDTADGFDVSGVLNLSWDREGNTTPTVALYSLYVRRPYTTPEGTLATPGTHMSGTLSHTGDHFVYQLGIETLAAPSVDGSCSTSAFVGTFDDPVPSGSSFDESSSGNQSGGPDPCIIGDDFFEDYLEMAFTVSAFSTGSGDITLDFGNTLVSTLQVQPAAVPEPATTLPMAAIVVAAALWARRRRSAA